MTAIIHHPPYRDDAGGPYPFADRATLLADTGMQLDADLFIDAILHPPLNVDPLYLSAVIVSDSTVRFEISSIYSSEMVCYGEVDFEATAAELVDDQGRHSGLLLIDNDRLGQFRSWALDTHTFTVDASTFVVTCVSPERRSGVTGIDDASGTAVAGDVWLVGERGVVITVEDDLIYVNAVGDPLWRRRICNGSASFVPQQYLKTINNIEPDEYGAWTLGIGTKLNRTPALRLTVQGNGLVLSVAGGK